MIYDNYRTLKYFYSKESLLQRDVKCFECYSVQKLGFRYHKMGCVNLLSQR